MTDGSRSIRKSDFEICCSCCPLASTSLKNDSCGRLPSENTTVELCTCSQISHHIGVSKFSVTCSVKSPSRNCRSHSSIPKSPNRRLIGSLGCTPRQCFYCSIREEVNDSFGVKLPGFFLYSSVRSGNVIASRMTVCLSDVCSSVVCVALFS